MKWKVSSISCISLYSLTLHFFVDAAFIAGLGVTRLKLAGKMDQLSSRRIVPDLVIGQNQPATPV